MFHKFLFNKYALPFKRNYVFLLYNRLNSYLRNEDETTCFSTGIFSFTDMTVLKIHEDFNYNFLIDIHSYYRPGLAGVGSDHGIPLYPIQDSRHSSFYFSTFS